MRRALLRAIGLLVVGAAIVGCRGCICTNLFSSLTDSPPDPFVREQVAKDLRKAAAVASELCGIQVEGLADATVDVQKQTLGTSTVHVKGKPLPLKGVDVPEALICAGVLSAVFVPLLDSDGKATGWKLGSMEVAGIETEGVEFDESKHHHHHHHH